MGRSEPGFGEDFQNQVNLRHNVGVATFVYVLHSDLLCILALQCLLQDPYVPCEKVKVLHSECTISIHVLDCWNSNLERLQP